MSASRWRVVLAADPHVAEEAAHLIVAEYEELPAVYDEVEAVRLQGDRSRRAQAGRHLPRPEAPEGQDKHQRRARLPLAPW
jgi:CO/xanthine dehydrogenase Mo-binding subunit